MDLEQPVIRISVRSLVEFILRGGDIDNRIAGTDKDAMLLGGKIHRKIQRQMGGPQINASAMHASAAEITHRTPVLPADPQHQNDPPSLVLP